MIVGNGDIARALLDNKDRIYFASGVSNSQETRESEYKREFELLCAQDKDKHLVYFSSLSIFYKESRYTKHKLYMEETIKHLFPRYTIVRLGNITWGNNPHTIINFLRNKIANNEEITIKDEYRYIVEKDEFLHWITQIPSFNCEMNVTGKRMKIVDIVKQYCTPKIVNGDLTIHTQPI